MSKRSSATHRLPGLRFSLTLSLLYLACMLIIPLGACLLKSSSLSVDEFIRAVWSPRARSAYALTFSTSALAAVINVFIGLELAWIIARYRFPGRKLLDAFIDLPFALPTAVAGLIFSGLLVEQGWYGRFFVPWGLQAAYARPGIVLVLMFVGLPFVVRTVQPVLESLEKDVEEAAAGLGANRWQTFRRVLLPALRPSLVTGFALALARGLGEYGSVVFIAGNMPYRTEIAPVLIVARLEEFAVPQATAIAVVLLMASLLLLGLINWLQRRSQIDEAA
jgi:sulfate transport system permease protein